MGTRSRRTPKPAVLKPELRPRGDVVQDFQGAIHGRPIHVQVRYRPDRLRGGGQRQQVVGLQPGGELGRRAPVGIDAEEDQVGVPVKR